MCTVPANWRALLFLALVFSVPVFLAQDFLGKLGSVSTQNITALTGRIYRIDDWTKFVVDKFKAVNEVYEEGAFK